MAGKKNVAIVFGGRSGEHEVSLLSAKSVYEAIDKEKYNVLLIGIGKNGQWYLGQGAQFLLNSSDPKNIKLNTQNATAIVPQTGTQNTAIIKSATNSQSTNIDVVFNIIHGTYGEDGSLQGFFELLNVAYVGAGVLGSAVGMDKDVMKRLLRDAGLPIGRFHTLRKNYTQKEVQKIAEDLKYPLFVKPANAGSSVGVSKAKDEQALHEAIKVAFQYDTKILIEEYIKGREVECSVLGNSDPIASEVGEITPTHEFYSYEAKYIDENGAILKIPAEITAEQKSEIQNIAIKTFQTLDCRGLARVDSFLTDNGKIFVNEINTLPGFTKISMYPKLWEASGIPYPKLIDKLIELAIEEKQTKDQLKRSYN